MYNVILLDKCNLRCSYCFAEDYMHEEVKSGPEVEVMSEKVFDDVVAFLKRSNAHEVSFLGGEPTLHPQFRKLWLKGHSVGIRFSLKSNALWDSDLLSFLNQNRDDDKFSFLLNVNGPQRLTAAQWTLVRRNVLALKSRNISLQVTVEDPEFDFSWLLDLAREARPRHIQWSLAAPQGVEGKRAHGSADYVRFKHSDGLTKFLKECGKMGITTQGSHGPTACLFRPQDFEEIKSLGGQIDGRCVPVFDIFPDGSIHYCFPLKDFVHPPIYSDVEDLQEVRSHFMRELFALRATSFPWKECSDCPEALEARCHGGCLSQKKLSANSSQLANEHFFQLTPFVNPMLIMGIDRKVVYLGRFAYDIGGVPFEVISSSTGEMTMEAIFSKIQSRIDGRASWKKRENFYGIVCELAGAGILHALPYEVKS